MSVHRAPDHITPQYGLPVSHPQQSKIAEIFQLNPAKFLAIGVFSSILGYAIGFAAPGMIHLYSIFFSFLI